MTALRARLPFAPKLAGALLLVSAGVLLVVVGMPTGQAREQRMAPELNRIVSSRERHVDPAELLSLMYNNQFHLFLIDVRAEADFNLFHLRDAIHRPVEKMTDACCRKLKQEGVKVVISNDEKLADSAFRHLTANDVPNVYILAGGINLWLDLFREGKPAPPHAAIDGKGEDRLRHRFERALGHDHPASLPEQQAAANREYPRKVKVAAPRTVAGGGCG